MRQRDNERERERERTATDTICLAPSLSTPAPSLPPSPPHSQPTHLYTPTSTPSSEPPRGQTYASRGFRGTEEAGGGPTGVEAMRRAGERGTRPPPTPRQRGCRSPSSCAASSPCAVKVAVLLLPLNPWTRRPLGNPHCLSAREHARPLLSQTPTTSPVSRIPPPRFLAPCRSLLLFALASCPSAPALIV